MGGGEAIIKMYFFNEGEQTFTESKQKILLFSNNNNDNNLTFYYI